MSFLSLSGCKPGPGSSCAEHEARCLDASREIVCDNGRFVETPCRGKAGCVTDDQLQRTSCDISGNRPGDTCTHGSEGVAVCQGEHAMLSCHGGTFVSVPCLGAKGCQMLGEQASCDQSVASPGDPCKKENAKACAPDASQVLACQNGKMAPLYFCRGDQHCGVTGGKLACDQTVALPGDVCDKSLAGSTACSVDKKAVLACHDERFNAKEKCKPGTQCVVSGASTACDKPSSAK